MWKYVLIGAAIFCLIAIPIQGQYPQDPYYEYSSFDDPLLCEALDMWGCSEKVAYGELYTHEVYTEDIDASSTWYNLTSINETGKFEGISQDATELYKMIIGENGTYMVDFSVSFDGGNNGEYHIGITVNDDDPHNKTHVHEVSDGRYEIASLSAILDLSSGDKIWLQVDDVGDPSQDVTINFANFNAHKIEGIISDAGVPYPGIEDYWVNETGDVMTGDLNITASLLVHESLNVSDDFFVQDDGDVIAEGHSAFGNSAALYNTRVMDVEETSTLDSNYQGVVSVFRQESDSTGNYQYAFFYEAILENDHNSTGTVAGYQGNTRNQGGLLKNARGGYVTVWNEYPYHNITDAAGLIASVSTRYNNIGGGIAEAYGFRPIMGLENGTIINATGFKMNDITDLTPARQGEIYNLYGLRFADFDSDKARNTYQFYFGDSKNTSRIRGNYSADQFSFLAYLNVSEGVYFSSYLGCTALETNSVGRLVCGTDSDTIYSGVDDDWVNVTGDTMTDNLTMDGKHTRIKGGIAFVESFPDIVEASQNVLGSFIWGGGAVTPSSPDVTRTINITFTNIGAETCTGFLYLNGTDAYGIYISELFVINVPILSIVEYETDHAYGNITISIEMSAVGDCAYDIGTTWRFGIANYPLNSVPDVYKVNVDGVHTPATAFEVIPRFGTINLELIPGLKDDAIFWYRYGVDT